MSNTAPLACHAKKSGRVARQASIARAIVRRAGTSKWGKARAGQVAKLQGAAARTCRKRNPQRDSSRVRRARSARGCCDRGKP
jgi:hypothetical protein